MTDLEKIYGQQVVQPSDLLLYSFTVRENVLWMLYLRHLDK